MAPKAQVFQYNADGNLTNEAVWAYRRDGENRLIQATNVNVSTLAMTHRGYGGGLDVWKKNRLNAAKGTCSIKNWFWNGTMGSISMGGKIVGAVVAFAAIDQEFSGSMQAAQNTHAYVKDAKNRGSEWLDFDSINIAIDVQNATGNYFMTYETLDIILQ